MNIENQESEKALKPDVGEVWRATLATWRPHRACLARAMASRTLTWAAFVDNGGHLP